MNAIEFMMGCGVVAVGAIAAAVVIGVVFLVADWTLKAVDYWQDRRR